MHAAANYKTDFSVATPKAAATCQAAWMYGVSGKKPSATNNAPPKSDDAACHLCASRNCGFSKVLSANVAYVVIHPSKHPSSICRQQLSICIKQLSICRKQLSICRNQLSICRKQLSICSQQTLL
jgi:hypothetical protein